MNAKSKRIQISAIIIIHILIASLFFTNIPVNAFETTYVVNICNVKNYGVTGNGTLQPSRKRLMLVEEGEQSSSHLENILLGHSSGS